MTGAPDYATLLRGVPLFSAVSESSLQRVVELATDVTHDAGHVVVKQGAGAHALHVIIEGEAAVEADGRSIATLGPGDYFGEIAVIDRSRRTASVIAVTSLRAIALDATSFRRLVRSDPDLAIAVMGQMAQRLSELEEQLGE